MDRGLWLALASLLVAGGAWALWVRAIQRVAIPRDRRGYVAAMLLAAVLAVAVLGGGAGWLGGLLAAPALGASAFFLVTTAISRQKGGPGAFRVGQPLPVFEALTEAGETFRVPSQLESGRPLLLKFFRGHW